MLSTITLLTCILFSTIYPLCFWISCRDPLKNNFHHFHLGLPGVVAGVILVFLIFSEMPSSIKTISTVWVGTLLLTTLAYWKKEYPNPTVISMACFLGICTFISIHKFLIGESLLENFSWILGGCIFCAALYTMNLGHWYLNVHGLPIKHLFRATYVLWGLVLFRALWDIFQLATNRILYDGDSISIISFLKTLDGFMLIIALFFGTLFPLIALYFVRGTLKLKNTQSATGILYVILCAVLIGDLTYKYYLIKFGVAL